MDGHDFFWLCMNFLATRCILLLVLSILCKNQLSYEVAAPLLCMSVTFIRQNCFVKENPDIGPHTRLFRRQVFWLTPELRICRLHGP